MTFEQTVSSISLEGFMALDLPPQEMILAPIIPKQGLAMLYAARGIGKTHVSLGIAFAVATGTCFIERWVAPTARKVLFIDGEMPARTLQERLRGIIKSNDGIMPEADYLRIITPDRQELNIPDLSTTSGQKLINEHIEGVELVIIDNLSTVCRSGKENESESWSIIQQWVLGLRKNGISVLFIHHAGKSNQQRGTSRREDILDTVIALKRPDNYKKSEGARFEVHYEKARGIFGDEANPFEVQLITEGENSSWLVSDVVDDSMTNAVGLSRQGMSQRAIAKEMGISKSSANRLLTAAKQTGDYQ